MYAYAAFRTGSNCHELMIRYTCMLISSFIPSLPSTKLIAIAKQAGVRANLATAKMIAAIRY